MDWMSFCTKEENQLEWHWYQFYKFLLCWTLRMEVTKLITVFISVWTYQPAPSVLMDLCMFSSLKYFPTWSSSNKDKSSLLQTFPWSLGPGLIATKFYCHCVWEQRPALNYATTITLPSPPYGRRGIYHCETYNNNSTFRVLSLFWNKLIFIITSVLGPMITKGSRRPSEVYTDIYKCLREHEQYRQSNVIKNVIS